MRAAARRSAGARALPCTAQGALVIDKWFPAGRRALYPAATCFARIRRLAKHPDYSLRNLNRARNLPLTMTALNPAPSTAPTPRLRLLGRAGARDRRFNPRSRPGARDNRWSAGRALPHGWRAPPSLAWPRNRNSRPIPAEVVTRALADEARAGTGVLTTHDQNASARPAIPGSKQAARDGRIPPQLRLLIGRVAAPANRIAINGQQGRTRRRWAAPAPPTSRARCRRAGHHRQRN